LTDTAPKKKCVLVVDDHPKVLKFVAIDLRLHGYDVIAVSSGSEALEQVKKTAPDIMLLDIIMPGIDGFEVLRQLRGFSQMPVITFSASASNYHDSIQFGANDFLTKPFQPDEMVRRIQALIGN
jgi:two-component system, OmpR family, KDP operon response regulator KdpE